MSDLTDHVRALNALITQSVVVHAGDRLSQVGANKFYVNGGHTLMNQSPNGLLAVRGYYTSVRPTQGGPLLNINTATSAFLPAVTVDKFVAIKGRHEAEKLLRGAFVRVTYTRNNPDGKDLNIEAARRKTFQHFGFLSTQQKLFKVLEKDKKNPRRTDPKDAGRAVADYFRTGKHAQRFCDCKTLTVV